MNKIRISSGQINDYLSLSKNISKREISFLLDNFYTEKDFIFTFYLNERTVLGLIICIENKNTKNALIYDFSSSDNDSLKKYGEIFLKKITGELSKKRYREVEVYFSETKTNHFEEVTEILQKVGFSLFQTKLKFILKNKKEITNSHFVFKSINDVGKNKFAKILQKISAESLDGEDIEFHHKYGSKQASLKYFEELKSQNFIPDLWELAFYKDSLVGLIISQIEDENTGSISYIGIIPEMRGKKFIDKLIWHSITKFSNKKRIIAETDVNNNPMIYAFLRNGFVVYDTTFLFRKTLL